MVDVCLLRVLAPVFAAAAPALPTLPMSAWVDGRVRGESVGWPGGVSVSCVREYVGMLVVAESVSC